MRLSLATGVLVLSAFFLPPAGSAQDLSGAARWADSARTEIHAAYLASDVQRLVRTRALLQRALTVYENNGLLLHYLGDALYREALLRGDTQEARSDTLLAMAREKLEASAEILQLPETHALLAIVLGRQIADRPALGRKLGPRIYSELERASALGPHNPRVSLIQGINALYTPTTFGGGVSQAMNYLARAIAEFKQDDPPPPLPAWGHAQAYAWLGIAHARANNFDRARKAFRKALQIEPNYVWLRSTVIPQVKEKAAKTGGH